MNAAHGGSRIDNQESFLFAEVLKYCYLAFSEGTLLLRKKWNKKLTTATDEEWQVAKDGKNQFVFNTEGHPMRVIG